jgi:DNA transformation protein
MKEMEKRADLTGIPNIGGVLAEKLAGAGITSYDDLASLGSVEAVLRIRAGVDPGACYNMLYAIEGAIRGVRWHTIPKKERNQLKREFDHAAGRPPRTGFSPRRGH